MIFKIYLSYASVNIWPFFILSFNITSGSSADEWKYATPLHSDCLDVDYFCHSRQSHKMLYPQANVLPNQKAAGGVM